MSQKTGSQKESRSLKRLILIAVITAVVVLLIVTGPIAVQAIRETVHRKQVAENLRELGESLKKHEAEKASNINDLPEKSTSEKQGDK